MNRIFPYDAFLSHNRDDGSANFSRDLAAAGVATWCDDSADLRNRRVRGQVAKALHQSRYIVVCIGPTFRDSIWVRAEYQPGLEFESKHAIPRVLVAAINNADSIPANLSGSPIYNIAHGELAWLAECLRSGNLPPCSPLAPLPRASAIGQPELNAAIKAVARGVQKLMSDVPWQTADTPFINTVARAAADRAKLKGPLDGIDIFQLADVCEHPAIATLSVDHFCKRMLRALALRVCVSEDTDTRGAGLRILLSLAQQEQTGHTSADVITFLEHEHDRAIIKLAEDWLRIPSGKPNGWSVDSLKIPSLRSSTAFKPSATAPFVYVDPLRVRDLLKRTSTTPDVMEEEILKLANERLDFLLASPRETTGVEQPLIYLFASPTHDIEVFLSEILDDLLLYSSAGHRYVIDHDVAGKPKVTDGVLRLIEKVAYGLQEARVTWTSDFVSDWILRPLLLLRQVKLLEERCTRCYEAACALIRADTTPYANAFSEAYLHLLRNIARGVDYETAHLECKVELLEARGASI